MHASSEVRVHLRQMHGPPGSVSNPPASCLLSLAACWVRVRVWCALVPVCAINSYGGSPWLLLVTPLPGTDRHRELVASAEGRAYLLWRPLGGDTACFCVLCSRVVLSLGPPGSLEVEVRGLLPRACLGREQGRGLGPCGIWSSASPGDGQGQRQQPPCWRVPGLPETLGSASSSPCSLSEQAALRGSAARSRACEPSLCPDCLHHGEQSWKQPSVSGVRCRRSLQDRAGGLQCSSACSTPGDPWSLYNREKARSLHSHGWAAQ